MTVARTEDFVIVKFIDGKTKTAWNDNLRDAVGIGIRLMISAFFRGKPESFVKPADTRVYVAFNHEVKALAHITEPVFDSDDYTRLTKEGRMISPAYEVLFGYFQNFRIRCDKCEFEEILDRFDEIRDGELAMRFLSDAYQNFNLAVLLRGMEYCYRESRMLKETFSLMPEYATAQALADFMQVEARIVEHAWRWVEVKKEISFVNTLLAEAGIATVKRIKPESYDDTLTCWAIHNVSRKERGLPCRSVRELLSEIGSNPNPDDYLGYMSCENRQWCA